MTDDDQLDHLRRKRVRIARYLAAAYTRRDEANADIDRLDDMLNETTMDITALEEAIGGR